MEYKYYHSHWSINSVVALLSRSVPELVILSVAFGGIAVFEVSGIGITVFRVMVVIAAIRAVWLVLRYRAMHRSVAVASILVFCLFLWHLVRIVEGSELRAVAFEGFSLLAVVFTLAIISRRYSNRESLDKALIVAGIISCGLALLRLEGTRISEDFARIDGQIALRGAFANPNDLAAFLLITLFAAIRIFFIDLYNRKWRYAAAVYMLFALITILSSGSRAGVVVLMSLICVVFLVIVARAVRAIRVEILIAAFAGFAVFVILLVFSPLSSGIDRVWVEFTQTGTNTGASRIEWFGLAVESIYESWGLGLGSAMAEDYGFNELTNSLANRRGNFHPHNLFVEITVQHGVIGLFLLSTAIYCLFTVSRQGERSNLSLVDSQAFRWSQLFAFMAISLMPSSILDDALLTMSFLGLYLSNPSHV